MCPGNGPNHTVGLNLATHPGVVAGTASFGVSDTAYAGTFQAPGPEGPVFVIYGQRLDLDAATEMTLRLTRNPRIPILTVGTAATESLAG